MNILFTCAGRRNYLLNYFREALNGGGSIHAVDSSLYAPALQEADFAEEAPLISDRGYIPFLVDYCRRNEIHLLVPLSDIELPYLADSIARFLAVKTFPLISAPEAVRICADKSLTGEFCARNGLLSPRTFLDPVTAKEAVAKGEITYPLVVKPRWGSASQDIAYVDNDEELDMMFRWNELSDAKSATKRLAHETTGSPVIIQQKLRGQEYGLDIVNDLHGAHRAVLAKKKIRMRAGETDQAETVNHLALTEVGRRIAGGLRHIGNLDCDVFLDGSDVYILEMNPRFGGGYPFSHTAGADVPAALLAWGCGEEASPAWLTFRPGCISSKCDRLVRAQRCPVDRGSHFSEGGPLPGLLD